MDPIQIFISYARADDEVPPDVPNAKGSVNFLRDQLNYGMKQLGPGYPTIWRDKEKVEPAHQFNPVIRAAVEASSLFIAVLSRNWLSSDYCRQELEWFANRWAAEGEEGVRRRLVVVALHHILPDERPPLLRDQEGYRFYVGDPGSEQALYSRGVFQDATCLNVIHTIGSYLWRTARDMTGSFSVPRPAPQTPPAAAPAPRPPEPAGRTGPAARGITVYLAKPAADMRQAYLRVGEELKGRGYELVPPLDAGIPIEEGANAFVAEALGRAKLSVHLLGANPGYKPEDSKEIVPLQLERAAARVGADGAGFRRIIWAPKVMEGGAGGAPVAERDPVDVLTGFDRQLPNDKVDGSALGRFIDFLLQNLANVGREGEELPEIAPEARVYVYHRVGDERYAFQLARALVKRQIEPLLPATQGDAGEREVVHRQYMINCDAIVLCWANASEAWAKATANELKDWAALGRQRNFLCRGLVAGPPEDDRKTYLVELPPKSEIDVALDLTGLQEPTPEALDPLVRRARPAAP